MTAEIGILNKYAVALAADSAVTIGNRRESKVLNSANKLFNMSCYEPIGIMIYSNADYMQTPWEIIIKQYRDKLGRNKYNTLEEYCTDFFEYVFSSCQINSEISQEKLVERLFVDRLQELLEITNKTIHDKFATIEPTEEQVKLILQEETIKYINEFEQYQYLNGHVEFSFDKYEEEYESLIINIINQYIKLNLEDEIINKLIYIGYLAIVKDFFSNYTGIVISGYGDEEIFPSLYEYYVSGSIKGFKKYKLNKKQVVSNETGNIASINPFAQQEMVHSVVAGIDPYLYNIIDNLINITTVDIYSIIKKINDENNLNLELEGLENIFYDAGIKIKREITNNIQEEQRKNYIDPILNMVSMLPKDELAQMAETLVNLTSFKRRITMEAETVGGPIDVAIISKNDGFIWIKRKHYFNAELNYNYFNKRKGVCNYVSN